MAAFKPEKEYQSIVICSPQLKKGSSYTIYSGGTSTGSLADGLYTGGTKVVDFAISSSVTWLSESGVTSAKSSNPGGPGGNGNNHGGGKP